MSITRRKLLGSAATALAGISIVPRHVLGGPGFVPPSEKVNIALVGAGGRGWGRRFDGSRRFDHIDREDSRRSGLAESR